jgi:uncharacterized membrane protein YoaK (UPF0700 family)
MVAPTRSVIIAALLAFNAGFVDTAGFLGLQGLFTAHVTGNFVTLGAALVLGTHGAIAKVLALPEFMVVIALVRLAEVALAKRNVPALRLLLGAKTIFLLLFFVLAVGLGPFPDSDAPTALMTGFAGIAAMAIQNAVQRLHFASLPPTTIMTGNTTQVVLDAVDLLRVRDGAPREAVRTRFGHLSRSILCFGAGCACAALLYAWIGFWCLVVPVVVGAASAVVRLNK